MGSIKLLKKFNTKANIWLLELEDMEEASLQKNPKLGSWSMAEVYDHILKVARTYQIPNFKKSITTEAVTKKRKNLLGFAIFNVGIRRQVTIKMEDFPTKLVEDFTPIKRNKTELLHDFKAFIREVNDLKEILEKKTTNKKHHHPMFGDISTANWFSLMEIHMRHHDHQKIKIKEYLNSI